MQTGHVPSIKKPHEKITPRPIDRATHQELEALEAELDVSPEYSTELCVISSVVSNLII